MAVDSRVQSQPDPQSVDVEIVALLKDLGRGGHEGATPSIAA
jgi:hypothetical protein